MERKQPLLALPPPDLSLDPLGQVSGNLNILSSYNWRFEAAGVKIQKVVALYLNQGVGAKLEESSGEDNEEELKEIKNENFEKKRKKVDEQVLLKKAMISDEHYLILGLDHLKIEATQKDIKAAYRKLALQHHPDKKLGELEAKIRANQTEETKEKFDIKEHPEYKKMELFWHKIQNAYECLIDPEQRYKYDSTLPFDDDIPSEGDDIDDENFFQIFEPVFRRNQQFSKIKPVPKLGEKNQGFQYASNFYEFWENFESWRDFSKYDEYDPKEAESRFEKRAMERENKKIREKHLKKQRARIIKLVDLAYKKDPRIKEEELKLQREKEKKKQEKREKAQRQYEKLKEMQQKEEEEKKLQQELKIQKQKQIKAKQEEEKQVLIQAQDTFITLCSESGSQKYDKYWAEVYCKQLGIHMLTQLTKECLEVGEEIGQFQSKIDSFIEQQELAKKKEAEIQKKKLKEEKKVQKQLEAWSTEELALLAKGNTKYPVGLKNRWKLISELIGTRTVKEVIKKSKEVAQSKPKQGITVYKPPSSQSEGVEIKEQNGKVSQDIKKEEWSSQQQKQLESALKKYPASLPAKERWTSISGEVEDKSAKDCLARYKWIVEMLRQKRKS